MSAVRVTATAQSLTYDPVDLVVEQAADPAIVAVPAFGHIVTGHRPDGQWQVLLSAGPGQTRELIPTDSGDDWIEVELLDNGRGDRRLRVVVRWEAS